MPKPHARARFAFGRRCRGLTLVELMVALAVGALLMLGAAELFMHALRTFRITESVARLAENARFALDAIEQDVQMAGFWGLHARSDAIAGRAGPADPPGTGPSACGNNWTTDLDRPLEAADGAYRWACRPAFAAMPDSDTLVVRRVDPEPAAPALGVLHVQPARFGASRLLGAAHAPGGDDAAASRLYRLSVNGYYVSARSTLDTPGNAVPALRVKTLQTGPAIVDQEVLPGIEDLQIRLGVDTDADGSVDRYVDPNDPLLDPASAQFLADVKVLALRIWLRARSERPEPGFTDTARYVYANRDVPAFHDAFRRLVVSRTVYVRNARGGT